ncbi:MAG: winged helix-turn-helix transcriptional regulator [Thermoanaerobaculia bacterium]|nr:winged helix-turn-helix transcriptional regulator [Thermoanaerobaculia bacterium]
MSRSYRQFCGVAKALDLVGERWTLLLVRDLILGPRRYTDLLHGLPGLTTNLLAKRLRELTRHGLIRRTTLPPPASVLVYELTEEGRRLEPVVLALGAFGAEYMTEPSPEDLMNARWSAVSLRRRFRGSPQQGIVQLEIGEQLFQARFGDEIEVRDGTPWAPDVRLMGDLPTWGALLTGRERLRDLVKRGRLRREGPAQISSAFARSVRIRP